MFGVDRAGSIVHNLFQKADLEQCGGRTPAQIALDETIVKLNGERFWLVAAVDPNINIILYFGLYASRTTAVTKNFLRELQDKHAIDDAEFLIDGAPGCMPAYSSLACTSATKRTATATPSNVSFKK